MNGEPASDQWRDSAKCKDIPALEIDSIFFVSKGTTTYKAKNYCKECPVRSQCLEFAVTHFEIGIWAGTSDLQRRKIREFRGLPTSRQLHPGLIETQELAEVIPLQRYSVVQVQSAQEMTLDEFEDVLALAEKLLEAL